MTRKELGRLKEFLHRVGPLVNPFRDECLAYVNKDLAIREQQSKRQKENMIPDTYPFYGQ